MEKEKEFERPKFSEYLIDWYYDHYVLVGFKNKRHAVTHTLPEQEKDRKDNDKPKAL